MIRESADYVASLILGGIGMEKILSSVYEKNDICLKYYEICSDNPPLVLIHGNR